MQSQFDIDDALIRQFLGPRYLGRRYLRYAELEALGLVDNRASLKNWMDAGAFPRGIKIPGALWEDLGLAGRRGGATDRAARPRA